MIGCYQTKRAFRATLEDRLKQANGAQPINVWFVGIARLSLSGYLRVAGAIDMSRVYPLSSVPYANI